jgi:pantoate--beta-alanine ligase
LKIFVTKAELSGYLEELKKSGKTIGFVPTMGALHSGHISLLEIAAAQSDIVVCSIFVNPTQFTDPEDLKKYPRPIEQDIEKLKKSKCDVLFLPEVDEIYPGKEKWHIDLGELENKLEAKYRPGHYQGVTQIVKKLLDIVKPDIVFFGQKDYQQFLVIQKMVRVLRIPVSLVVCPIVRETDGLALSSRNIHLSDSQHKQALALSQVLNLTKRNFEEKSIPDLKKDAVAFLSTIKDVEPEYFEICNAKNLHAAVSKKTKSLIALVAAQVGNTRLIDNIILK